MTSKKTILKLLNLKILEKKKKKSMFNVIEQFYKDVCKCVCVCVS